MIKRWLLLVAVLLVAGCAARTARRPVDTGIFVECRNLNWSRVECYVVTFSGPLRVAVVESMSAETAFVPEGVFAGPMMIRLAAVTTESGVRFVTRQIPVYGGMRLKLIVENQIHLSTWKVSRD